MASHTLCGPFFKELVGWFVGWDFIFTLQSNPPGFLKVSKGIGNTQIFTLNLNFLHFYFLSRKGPDEDMGGEVPLDAPTKGIDSGFFMRHIILASGPPLEYFVRIAQVPVPSISPLYVLSRYYWNHNFSLLWNILKVGFSSLAESREVTRGWKWNSKIARLNLPK